MNDPLLPLDLLVVATQRRWIAEDLAAAGVLPVVADPGLDAPLLPDGLRAAWWTPGEHAARLAAVGVPLTLQSAGPGWLTRVPMTLLGRAVWTGTLTGLLTDGPRSGFAKPAEAKIDHVPAGWWGDLAGFAHALRVAGAPEDLPVHVADTHLVLTDEYRCFIAHGQVTATGPYVHHEQTWDPAWDAQPDPRRDAATAFAQQTVDAMGPDQPDGYVLDVARTAANTWIVVEANAAWSSNIYGCAPREGVIASILAANQPSTEFAWEPDPWQAGYAAARRPLRLAPPAWPLPLTH